MSVADIRRKREPLPSWFKTKLPEAGAPSQSLNRTTQVASSLHTVCEEAKCPNRTSCWSSGTATFMVAGQHCTRNCRFCSVDYLAAPPPPDAEEPARLAEAIAALNLEYVVITVVNRDDLPDGGAAHYRACLDAVHQRSPKTGLELLGSDLSGNETALQALLHNAPLKVFAHNVETVERLTPNIRDRKASFAVSLRILEASKELRPDVMTKSSLMLGLGENANDVKQCLHSLRNAGVDLLTLGQYLAPTAKHYPILSFPTPAQFAEWKEIALQMGFKAVASGPLVRSSYRGGELYQEALAYLKKTSV